MNNFNTKRWLRYTKRHLYQHRSKLVRHMLIVFVITLVFTLLASYFNVSSTNSEQSKLCINGPLYIDAWLLWEQAIGSNGP